MFVLSTLTCLIFVAADQALLEQLKQQQLKLQQQILQQEQQKQKLQQKLQQQKLQEEKFQQERQQQQKLLQQKLQQQKLQQQKLQQQRLQHERLQQERLQQERLQEERLQQKRLQQEKLQQERLQQERLQDERLQQEGLQLAITSIGDCDYKCRSNGACLVTYTGAVTRGDRRRQVGPSLSKTIQILAFFSRAAAFLLVLVGNAQELHPLVKTATQCLLVAKRTWEVRQNSLFIKKLNAW